MNPHPQHVVGQPHHAGLSLGTRVGLAAAALVCSSVVMGGGLGLFEMQARAAQSAWPEAIFSAGTPGVTAAAAKRAARRV